MEDFEYKIVIEGRPPAKSNCYKVRAFMQGGKPRAVLYTTRELENFEKMAGEFFSEKIPAILDCALEMEVLCYQYGKRSIDIDNILKALGDAGDYEKSIKDKFRDPVSGGWRNDKLFWKFIPERKIAKTKDEERVEIFIRPYKGETNLEL